MSPSDDDGEPPAQGDLGFRLRAAREHAGLSMRALARLCGVSQPFLSMVERGQSAPSLATLYRIAAALGIAPVDLLPLDASTGIDESAPGVTVVRSGDGRRLRVSDSPDSAIGTVLAATLGLEVVEYRVRPGQHLGGWFTSKGVQSMTILDGELRVELEGAGDWMLSTGDTLTHPSTIAHRWSIGSERGAHLILVVAR